MHDSRCAGTARSRARAPPLPVACSSRSSSSFATGRVTYTGTYPTRTARYAPTGRRAVTSTRSDASPPLLVGGETEYPLAPSIDGMPTRVGADASTPMLANGRRRSDASSRDQSREGVDIYRPQPSRNHPRRRDVVHSPALELPHPRCCAGDASTSAWQRVSCFPAATSARLMCPRCNDPRVWVFPDPPRTPFVHPSSPTASVSRA